MSMQIEKVCKPKLVFATRVCLKDAYL